MLGSLSALSALESEATGRQKRQTEEKSRQRDRQNQLQTIEQLKQQRDELLQQLRDRSDSESGVRDNKRSDAETEDEASNELTSALEYVTELKEKLQVYKMTGVSVVKTDQDNKVLCFTTSYKGLYLESYHLKVQRLPSGTFKVVHHDLPPFIVHSCLPGDLEVKDMQSAVRPLRETLAMFVLRREELNRAQRKFPDSFHVMESSAAFDYLCCHLDVNENAQLEITLTHTDLNHYLPSTVKTVLLKRGRKRVKEELPEDVVDSVCSDFCSHYLSDALTQTVQRLHTFLHTDPPHSAEEDQ